MPLPLTFSAPGSTHEPSPEDSLQFGVWLMLMADNVNRDYYSHKPGTPAAGVRIVMDVEHVDNENEGRIVVPQQLVKIGIDRNAWAYNTSGGGEKTIHAIILHIEKKTTETIDQHSARVSNVPASALMLMARTEQILMRGTLFQPDQLTNESVIVDPFNSPMFTEDDAPDPSLVGAYDPSRMRTLNRPGPELRRGMVQWRLRPATTLEAEEKLDLSRDLAVAYIVFASYRVKIHDRDDMTRGGFDNA